jgi:predicted nucleic acid-binding protein
VITLDTSAIVALVNRSDVRHGDAAHALADHAGPTVVPLAILAEVAHVLDGRLGRIATTGFLRGLEQGESLLDCGDGDVPRIRELMARFTDPPLGFTGAAVVACAERNGGDVLTFDRLTLEPVAREVPVSLVP